MLDSLNVNTYKLKIPGVSKKVIYHFSDVHIAAFDELSKKEEKEYAIKKTEDWKRSKAYFAKLFGGKYDASKEESPINYLHKLISLSNKGDALIMTGDVIDYSSPANLRLLSKELKSIKTPYLYICGNHDTPTSFNDDKIFDSIKLGVQKLDLLDIVVLGFDNSDGKITKEQIEFLTNELKNSKPIIIAMHMPILVEDNKEIIEHLGEYYALNKKEANLNTLEFVDLIKQNSKKIAAVLAGHLHIKNVAKINDDLTQYVVPQGILGNINKYEINF